MTVNTKEDSVNVSLVELQFSSQASKFNNINARSRYLTSIDAGRV